MAGHAMHDDGRPHWRGDRSIGTLIEQARGEAGKSQEALAAALREESGNAGVDKKSVSRWEHGRRIPTPYWRGYLSTVLGIPLDQLDRAAAAARAQRGNGIQGDAADASADRIRGRDGENHVNGIGAQDATTRSPDALGAHGSERLVRAMQDSSNADEVAVGHLESITDSHRRLYHAVSSFELIHIVRGHLHGVVGLLRGQQPAALRRRLAAIACETAGHAGWLAHDLDDRASSEQYYSTAVVVAKETGDPALSAYIRGFMSVVHASRDQPLEALALARSARDQAGRSATATTRSWLESLVAQAHAAIDERTACLAALNDAERILDQARPDQDPAWQYAFDGGRFYALAGRCYRQLGMTVLAERTLHDALALLEPSCVRRRSEVMLELAQVGLQRRDVDQACSYAVKALAGMLQLPSIASVKQIYQFRASLEPWRGAAAVSDLDERLSATL
jgi:transcriptional regulator with XRE-family HTH domain